MSFPSAGRSFACYEQGLAVGFDKQSGLPTEVMAAMSAYLRLAYERLPDRISGLYLIGSLALDDYRPGQSDIDFVTIPTPY